MKAENAICVRFKNPNEVDWLLSNLHRVKVNGGATYVDNETGETSFAVLGVRGINKKSFIKDFKSLFVENGSHRGFVKENGEIGFFE